MTPSTPRGYAIRIQNQERIRLEGAGATLLLGADRRGLALHGCQDAAVRGLRVDYDPLPFAETLVIGVDRASRAVVARIGDGFAMPPAGGPTRAGGEQAYFAMLWNPGPHALRSTHYRVTLEHCDVTALLWFYGEHIEGPLPSGSVVRHCRLRLGRGNPELAVACNGRINGLPAPAATTGMPPLVDLQFEDNEMDGRFDLRHARKVQLVNNRFAPERGQLTIGDSREILLKGNRLGEDALPATRIQIEDQATRDSLTEQ